MKFGTVETSEAGGAILAHTVRVGGQTVRKGSRLTEETIAALAGSGVTSLMVARLESGDVPEDEAAARIAAVVAGSGTVLGKSSTGRSNIFSVANGLAIIEREAIIAANGIDEGLTIATLSPFARVTRGQMVATVKIIPFALPEAVVAEAERRLRGNGGAIAVEPFRTHQAGLLLTRTGSEKEGIIAKKSSAVAQRVAELGSEVVRVETVRHDTQEVEAALVRLAALKLDPLLVFGASAIVDRGDVIPAAVTAAGGEVVHLGMPVDPGNLLLYGRMGDAAVIGVPSCASSLKINGFDWVLERCLAGRTVTHREFVEMAVGGLLMEISTRPQPRARQDKPPPSS